MKKLILIQMSIIFISCQANEEKTENKMSATDSSDVAVIGLPADSVTTQHKFAKAPFDKNDDMAYFSMKMRESTKTETELKTNKYDPSVKDTIKTIYWDKSYIKTLTNKTMDHTIVIEVNIKDNNLLLSNGLKIGQSASEVFKSFKINYNDKKSYKFLRLNTPDDPNDVVASSSSLIFYFKDNKLVEINYWPWFD